MSALLRTILSAAAVRTAVASCAYGTTLSPRAEGEVPISTFGYAGAMGPANWFSLNATTNSACAEGTHQSPIDITGGFTELAGSQLKIDIPDFASGATFENLGSTIEVIGETGTLQLPSSNKTFNFKQFHFHTPSEHLENGTAIAMEVHFVFQADDAEISVLGVYIDIADATTAAAATHKKRQDGKKRSHPKAKRAGCPTSQKSSTLPSSSYETSASPSNGSTVNADASTDSASAASSVIETIFASVGDITQPGTATTTAAITMADVVSFLQSTTFRTYSGSLTTPPCSEGVNWHVAADMLSVSLSSYKAARDVIGFNSRYAQSAPGEENALSAFFSSMSSSVSSTA